MQPGEVLDLDPAPDFVLLIAITGRGDAMTGWGLIGASNIARQYMISAIRAQPVMRWSAS